MRVRDHPVTAPCICGELRALNTPHAHAGNLQHGCTVNTCLCDAPGARSPFGPNDPITILIAAENATVARLRAAAAAWPSIGASGDWVFEYFPNGDPSPMFKVAPLRAEVRRVTVDFDRKWHWWIPSPIADAGGHPNLAEGEDWSRVEAIDAAMYHVAIARATVMSLAWQMRQEGL